MQKHKKEQDTVQRYLTTIAQPIRLEILVMLRDGELCVCDIFERLQIAQNLASHHLKVLADFGLVTSKKEGVKVIYSRNEKKIDQYQSLLTNTIQI